MKKKEEATPNQRLKGERELRGWSQKYVAHQIEAEQYYISRWERGMVLPSPYYRHKLCELFGKNAKELGLLFEESHEEDEEHSQHAPSPPRDTSTSEESLHDPAIPLPLVGTKGLVGRESLLCTLKQQLCSDNNQVLTAFSGLPGVGKTALAVAIAHDTEIQAHFRDGILWSGLGRKPNVLGLLSRWGTLLSITSAEMARLNNKEAWMLALRTAIGQRRMLLVIDDAWSAEEAFAFKVGGPQCAYLITTRLPEVATRFAGEDVTVVQELCLEDGIELLKRLASTVVERQREEVAALVRAVGGLPLALTLIGNHLRVQAHSQQHRRIQLALAQLHTTEKLMTLEQPQDSMGRHPGLSIGMSLSLRTVIGISDEALDDSVRKALQALSVFPPKPNSFSENAALAVAASCTDTLDTLVDAGLLESNASDRYTLHQTIADYAAMMHSNSVTEERMVEYYSHFVDMYQTDYNALEQEHTNILAALSFASARGMDALLVQMTNAFFPFWDSRGLYTQAEMHLQRAQQAARVLGNTRALTMLLFNLGKVAEKRGEYVQAEAFFDNGLELARQSEDRQQICVLLLGLGSLANNHADYVQAERYFEEGLDLARKLEDRRRTSMLLANLGSVSLRRGEYARAEAYYQEGLLLARQMEYVELLCAILTGLGAVAGNRGDVSRAICYYEEGLALARQIGHRDRMCLLLSNLGAVNYQLGKLAQTITYYEEGLALARQIGHRDRICLLLANMGSLAVHRSEYTQAEEYLQEGLALARQMEHPERISLLLTTLGITAIHRGAYKQAEESLQEGLSLAQQVGHRERMCLLLVNLSVVAERWGAYEQAEQYLQEGVNLARQIKHHNHLCLLLANLGVIVSHRETMQATFYLQEGLALARQFEHHDNLCLLLLNAGGIAYNCQDYIQAEAYWREGLELARLMEKRDYLCLLLVNLGALATHLEKYEQAEAYLRESQKLSTQIHNHLLVSITCIEEGELCLKRQQLHAAWTHFNEVLAAVSENERGLIAVLQYALARVAADQGNKIAACQHGERSLAIFEALGHRKAVEVREWLDVLTMANTDQKNYATRSSLILHTYVY